MRGGATGSLTTFGDLYREALPEERRELIRLGVNQLIWAPDEIRLVLLDQVVFHQGLRSVVCMEKERVDTF